MAKFLDGGPSRAHSLQSILQPSGYPTPDWYLFEPGHVVSCAQAVALTVAKHG
jgi:hypothetical protein